MNWRDFPANWCFVGFTVLFGSYLIVDTLIGLLLIIIFFDIEIANRGCWRLRADIPLVVFKRLLAIPVALTAIFHPAVNNLSTTIIRILGCLFTSSKPTIRQASQHHALGLLVMFIACRGKQQSRSNSYTVTPKVVRAELPKGTYCRLLCLVLYVASCLGRAIDLLKPKGGMMSLSHCPLVKTYALHARVKAVCVGLGYSLGPILCFSAPPGWRTETCQAGTGASFVMK